MFNLTLYHSGAGESISVGETSLLPPRGAKVRTAHRGRTVTFIVIGDPEISYSQSGDETETWASVEVTLENQGWRNR